MNNKIFRLWLKMTNKLSGSLKLVLAIVFSLLFNIAFADAAPDFTKPENYLPGKKYRVYGQGRGQVVNLRGGVHLSGGLSSVDGSFGRETGVYDGKIQYEQVFNDHPYWEHGPFDSSQTAKFSNRFATVGDGFIVNKVTIKARELHPADGYDGEPDPNGRFPSPTGARDEYTYEVHGTSAKIKPVYPDKPKPLPETPKRDKTWAENEPFSEPLSDRDIERIQEYLDTHPNAEGLPDSVKDAKQPHDFDWTQGNWESAEVAPPTSDLNRNNNFGENNTNPYWNELQLADDLAAGTSVGWDAHAGLGMSQTITYQGNGEVEVAIACGLGAGASVSADHRIDLLSANDDDLSGKAMKGVELLVFIFMAKCVVDIMLIIIKYILQPTVAMVTVQA